MAEAKTGSTAASHVALITGSTGLVGRYLIMHLLKLGNWKVYAISRGSSLPLEEVTEEERANLHHKQVSSLADKKTAFYQLRDLKDVTHIFHCAFHTQKGDQYQDVVDNLAMLRNVVEAVEEVQGGDTSDKGGGPGAGKLQHVYVQAGSKWYGQHLGKYKTPAKETDSRYLTPNFYYDLVDYCQARVEGGASWTWSSLLPNPVIGYSPASFMNLLNAIAGYAVICRQLRLPFRFPGSDAAYDALTECCDVKLLAEAIVFVSTQPEAANKIFNVSNGDVFRWSEVWPAIAKIVGLEAAPPQAVSLTELMAMPDKCRAWQAALQQTGLSGEAGAAANDYGRLIAWEFADFCFGKGYDFFQSVTKLRQAGFNSMRLDTTDMWLGWMKHLDQMQLFPTVTVAAATSQQPAGQPGSVVEKSKVVEAPAGSGQHAAAGRVVAA